MSRTRPVFSNQSIAGKTLTADIQKINEKNLRERNSHSQQRFSSLQSLDASYPANPFTPSFPPCNSPTDNHHTSSLFTKSLCCTMLFLSVRTLDLLSSIELGIELGLDDVVGVRDFASGLGFGGRPGEPAARLGGLREFRYRLCEFGDSCFRIPGSYRSCTGSPVSMGCGREPARDDVAAHALPKALPGCKTVRRIHARRGNVPPTTMKAAWF